MSKFDYLLVTILTATSDNNIGFAELRSFLKGLGFDERIKGGHFIFSKTGVAEIVNIQPEGNKAKAYQVKQVRNLILKYKLARELS